MEQYIKQFGSLLQHYLNPVLEYIVFLYENIVDNPDYYDVIVNFNIFLILVTLILMSKFCFTVSEEDKKMIEDLEKTRETSAKEAKKLYKFVNGKNLDPNTDYEKVFDEYYKSTNEFSGLRKGYFDTEKNKKNSNAKTSNNTKKKSGKQKVD